MIGFFKQWASNAAEYKRLQQELTEVLAPQGINFMHLHPEIGKFLVAVSQEEGPEKAVARLSELMEMVSVEFPHLSQEQAAEKLLETVRAVNAMGTR